MKKKATIFYLLSSLICFTIEAEANSLFYAQQTKSNKAEYAKALKQTESPAISATYVLSSEPASSDISITAGENCIYIRSSKKVLAKIYTILGQLVTQEYVGPGNSTIQSLNRGIYIVKVGALTQRVTL